MTSSSTVKCATCNIVINEVLAFMQNKLGLLDNETLIRICVTGFSEEDVSNAKKLLFTSIEGSGRMKSRRVDKVQRDLEDMATLLLNTDPEKTPLFVAKDLHKLPPVDFKHVDVTRLLKDLRFLQSEMRVIQETYVTSEQLCALKQELQCNSNTNKNKSGSCDSFINVNKKRGEYLCESKPFDLTFNDLEMSVTERRQVADPALSEQLSALSFSRACVQYSNSLPRASSSQLSTPTEQAPCEPVLSLLDTEHSAIAVDRGVNLSSLNTHDLQLSELRVLLSETKKKQENRGAYAQAGEQEGEWKEHKDNEDNDGWTTVLKRNRRNRFVGNSGKAMQAPGAKFKAAVTKVPLFISNVDPSTSEQDISEYILGKTQDKVTLYKIEMKKFKGYSAYKVYVNREKLDIYLNKDLWPRGIQFRRFVVFSKPNVDNNMVRDTSDVEHLNYNK